MDKEQFTETIKKIIGLLKEAGYDPYAQLTGYIKLGCEDYITRHGGARELIKVLDIKDIEDYLNRIG